MTKDDVLFGYRQQLFAEAARTSVSAACRTFGVHRSTYYALEAPGRPAWPGDAPAPGAPAAADAQRATEDDRGADRVLLDRSPRPRSQTCRLGACQGEVGRDHRLPNGVWKVLCRHGLNTRAKRLGLIAGYAAPYEPPRDPAPERHIDVDRPGELVGIDCFYVGRLKGTEGAIWQLTAIDIASSYAWAELVICKQGNPTARQTSKLAERVASELKAAGWKLERMLSDNGNEFKGDFTKPLTR